MSVIVTHEADTDTRRSGTTAASPAQILKLERGRAKTAHVSTARLLAEALDLASDKRTEFIEAALHGRTSGDVADSTNPPGFRALPRDAATFTGRARILDDLMKAITDEIAAGGVLPIHAVDGMAGVGKTVFMLHAAHRLADLFPDGQIFIKAAARPGHGVHDPAFLATVVRSGATTVP